MKTWNFSNIIFVSISIIASSALAQVDPSAALLLRKSSNPQDDYSSSRYQVKPKNENETVESTIKSDNIRNPQKFVEESPPQTQQQETAKPDDITEPPKETKNSVDLKKELVFDSDISLEKYRSLLHPLDRRRNMIDFSIGPNYFYQNSSSRYWIRNYYSSSMGLDTSLSMWLSPNLGMQISYFTSLRGELKSRPEGTELLEVDHTWFTAGFRYRNFYGLSRKARSLVFGLDFYEYKFDIPATADYRLGLESKGVKVSLETDLPISNTRSWYVGFEVMPNLSHKELKKEGDVESGSQNSSSAMGIWFGRKIKFDRKNELYWKLHHRVEKNNFSGETEIADPFIQSKIKGNTVTNSTSFFQLGFTWGR